MTWQFRGMTERHWISCIEWTEKFSTFRTGNNHKLLQLAYPVYFRRRDLENLIKKETLDPSQLVSWCFEPSHPQRITSELYTNFTLSLSYSFHKSSYHKSCFLSLFIFRGHSTREPASGRVTYFILRAYTGTMCVSHSQHRRNRERFGKNAGEWTRRVKISKEEIPGSKRSMYG